MTAPLKTFALSTALLLAGVALPGCQSFTGPGPIATGYGYHQGLYKTQIPERPFGAAPAMSGVQASRADRLWGEAMDDLIVQLEEHIYLPQKLVRVEPIAPRTPFLTKFNFYLQDALVENGYAITVDANAPAIVYEVTKTGDPLEGSVVYHNNDTHHPYKIHPDEAKVTRSVTLYLSVTDMDGVLTTVSGDYPLPADETVNLLESDKSRFGVYRTYKSQN